jgi:hypothetical protein
MFSPVDKDKQKRILLETIRALGRTWKNAGWQNTFWEIRSRSWAVFQIITFVRANVKCNR